MQRNISNVIQHNVNEKLFIYVILNNVPQKLYLNYTFTFSSKYKSFDIKVSKCEKEKTAVTKTNVYRIRSASLSGGRTKEKIKNPRGKGNQLDRLGSFVLRESSICTILERHTRTSSAGIFRLFPLHGSPSFRRYCGNELLFLIYRARLFPPLAGMLSQPLLFASLVISRLFVAI